MRATDNRIQCQFNYFHLCYEGGPHQFQNAVESTVNKSG